MGDWSIDDDDDDLATAVAEDRDVAATPIDSTGGQNILNTPNQDRRPRGSAIRRRGRRRAERIGEEIELYCNPFVEVYGRLAMYVRRLTRRWMETVAGMMMGMQENVVWREVLYVVDHTAW
eukprot:GFUD01022304.1.p1 GENE.GFUD01022304.1~~GFUD01022304.1.p1  ORF type:complete len:121 (+),score=35.53 GFUD01022304.1:84-446(+)